MPLFSGTEFSFKHFLPLKKNLYLVSNCIVKNPCRHFSHIKANISSFGGMGVVLMTHMTDSVNRFSGTGR